MIVAREGTLHLQLPISQGAVTALGYHGTDGNSVPLEPVGRQANEGVLSGMVHWLFGGGGKGRPTTSSAAARVRTRARSTSGRPRDRRLLAGRRDRGLDRRTSS